MIEEFADGNALDQLGHAADVVGVEVGDEDVIDPGNAGVVHGGLNAVGIAAIVARPAGVDEERCAGRGDQQRGLAAFDINGVDAERRCRI